MRKFFLLALAGACSAAGAQTPAPGLMPDGSLDMYAGLGARWAPNYEGGSQRGTRALPVLQAAWSNGAFVSGMSAGWHLSRAPSVEFGPLLALHGARRKDGSTVLDSAQLSGAGTILPPGSGPAGVGGKEWLVEGPNWMRVREVGPRLEAGAFFNTYLAPRLRLANSVLYGAGAERDGLRWTLDLQRGAIELAPHHTLSVGVGATVVNRAYNASYFGLRREDWYAEVRYLSSWGVAYPFVGATMGYAPGGGVKELRAAARWHWALSPSWLLTTNVQYTSLRGDARRSPLAVRPDSAAVTSALAYRF